MTNVSRHQLYIWCIARVLTAWSDQVTIVSQHGVTGNDSLMAQSLYQVTIVRQLGVTGNNK